MSNTDQIEFWNGPAGERWVSHAMQLDEMLSGFAARILDDAGLQAGEHVLDIGCGGGTLTLGAASRGCVSVGVDVSAPLLELAVPAQKTLATRRSSSRRMPPFGRPRRALTQ